MVLVAGYSGVGKTAVVNEVHKPIVAARGYFIKGKFDQLGRNVPFSALIQALRELMGLLLGESDAQIQQWKSKILSALGKNAQVIIEVIPELELIIGKQPTVTELSGSAATHRFNLLFQKFIKIFSTKEHPLVVFLDDLQWADLASLKLITLLMSQIDNNHLLLICSYRDNEVNVGHPFLQTLEEIQKAQTPINTINLTPLKKSDLNNLVADTLYCSKEIAQPLTELIYQKTHGNPFFSNQFLKSLHQERLIYFNFDYRYWECDIATVRRLALTDDVVEFMGVQLQKLPESTQKVLKLAACIGNSFDLNTLSIVHEKSEAETAVDLWKALQEGLILPTSELYKFYQEVLLVDGSTDNTKKESTNYRFFHDRVQQAAYSLFQDEKQLTHLKIGKLLLKNIPEAEREEKILDIVNQLNIGVDLITDEAERDELAKLNLIAGRKAKAATAYSAAIKYFQVGLGLLQANSWDVQYELTLSLYIEATETVYLIGNFQEMDQLAEVVLTHTLSILDQVKVYEVKIQALIARKKLNEAIDTALNILHQLGISFPRNPTKVNVLIAFIKTKSALIGKQIKDLVNLPKMTDLYQISVMRILLVVVQALYVAAPNLYAMIVFKKIELSIKYGNSRESAINYLEYGLIICHIFSDIKTGSQFGEMAIQLLEQSHEKQFKSRIYMTFYSFISRCTNHLNTTFQPLLEAYYIGLETGELEYAGYAAHIYSLHLFHSGNNLSSTKVEILKYGTLIEKLNQKQTLVYHKTLEQSVLNLIGEHDNPSCLIGSAFNVLTYEKTDDKAANFGIYDHTMRLSYLFGNYSQARENMLYAEQYIDGVLGVVNVPTFYFYSSLVNLALYSNVQTSEKRSILRKVKASQKKIKQWADYAPMNHLHKWYLIEAEKCRVLGKNREAMEHYDHAITLASTNEYTQEQAIANELAGKFYLEWGKQNIAQVYLTQAYYCYARWGAKAKLDDLQKRYPELLAPILQQDKTTLDIHTTISTLGMTSISESNTSDVLDLAAVVKASTILSGEIQLEQLLSTLMQVLMQNSGASKCALILHQHHSLQVAVTSQLHASSNTTTTIIKFTPLESSLDVPLSLINYIYRTKESLVVDDAVTLPILSDSYILRCLPKSLLCIPVMNQGKLLGILYLENNLTSGAFTSDRAEILKLITTQAAVSLENAILYENLEDANRFLEQKVAERTQELNQKNQRLAQALKELKLAQTQLIQAEKMSSLGQMVAGIAHEINNPISFIQGNIAHTSEYTQSLLELLAVYQQEYPTPSTAVLEKAQKIDLDFLVQDLPQLLNSMDVGSARIKDIVLGLRNFSRLDEAEMKPVDIHEGIENTLMILQHRLQEVQVIKEYGQLPKIICYASGMNQVFMNILSNAIDALNSRTSQEFTPYIHIQTDILDEKWAKISIQDNGIGMDTETKSRIFDPFFTTKKVGSGKGLGLSISYQIITEHGGKINCTSTIGQGTKFTIQIPLT
jgi:predicted ATPase/signal transduction histidine kinase